MSYIHIYQGKYPDGLTVTPGEPSGGEMSEGTYYFRVSCQMPARTGDPDYYDGEGYFGEETCACEEVAGTLTAPNDGFELTWNAVPGITTYRVYLRKSTETWYEGYRAKASPQTNSYTCLTENCWNYFDSEHYWVTENTSFSVYGTIMCGQIFKPSRNHDVSALLISAKRVGSPGTLTISINPVHRITIANTMYWEIGNSVSTGTIDADEFSTDFTLQYPGVSQAWLSDNKEFVILFWAQNGDEDNYVSIEAKSGTAYAYGYISGTTASNVFSYTPGTTASFYVMSRSTPTRFLSYQPQEHELGENYIQPILPVTGSTYPRQLIQHMGKGVDLKRFDVFLLPDQARASLNCLRNIQACGVPVKVMFYHGENTWLDSYYFLKKITWSLSPGTSVSWMHSTLDFVEG